MRLLRAVPCVLVLACLFPAASLADDFSDYRIPDHFGGGWFAGVNGATSSVSHNEQSEASRARSSQAMLSGSWNRFRDSDRWQWQLAAKGGLTGNRGKSRDEYFLDFPGSPPTRTTARIESSGRITNETLGLFASAGAYCGKLPVGWQVAGAFDLLETQAWSDRLEIRTLQSLVEFRDERSADQSTWRYEERATLTAALAIGRVRDATPVFQAILLEERLRRDGALVRPLSPAARQRVADLYAIRFDFRAPHDLPEKFFWREMERLLREDGAVADSGFDAYALHHADEALIVARSGFYRQAGWVAGPTLAAHHQHAFRRDAGRDRALHFTDGTLDAVFESSFGFRQKFSFDRVEYGLNAGYHRPLGKRSQLDLSETASIEFKSDPDAFDLYGSASLQRLIAERWFGQVAVFHSRTISGDPDFSRWYAHAGGTINYFLEDFVWATLDLGQDWASDQDLSTDRRQDVAFTARVSLNFGRGRLDAPGLIAAQRPLN